jgi:hypothetical protein
MAATSVALLRQKMHRVTIALDALDHVEASAAHGAVAMHTLRVLLAHDLDVLEAAIEDVRHHLNLRRHPGAL